MSFKKNPSNQEKNVFTRFVLKVFLVIHFHFTFLLLLLYTIYQDMTPLDYVFLFVRAVFQITQWVLTANTLTGQVSSSKSLTYSTNI